MQNNPFADEWRKCLREHYKYIIRTQDVVTEKSLVTVMQQVGFSETELAELRVEATIRADSVPDDFVPDMQVLERVRAEAAEQETIVDADSTVHPVPDLPIHDMVDVEDDDATEDNGFEDEDESEEEIILDNDADDDAPNQLKMF